MNNKPDWNIAPEWAEWLGQDADGTWWFYGEKPRPWNGSYWLTSHVMGRQCPHKDAANPAWRKTLEQRP